MARVEDRGLEGLGTFLITLLIVFALLRFAHVATPMFFPQTHPGPIVVEEAADAAGIVDFAPLQPAYRPRSLGEEPPHVEAVRLPSPSLRMEWTGERFLTLVQSREAEPVPGDAESPEDVPGARIWRDGDVTHAALEQDGVQVRLSTDLPRTDVLRLLRSLRPA